MRAPRHMVAEREPVAVTMGQAYRLLLVNIEVPRTGMPYRSGDVRLTRSLL